MLGGALALQLQLPGAPEQIATTYCPAMFDLLADLNRAHHTCNADLLIDGLPADQAAVVHELRDLGDVVTFYGEHPDDDQARCVAALVRITQRGRTTLWNR